MGAWGSGPFDNDDAADWLYELYECTDLSEIRSALMRTADTSGYLDAPTGAVALAAATVLAGALGQVLDLLPYTVTVWLEQVRPVATADDLHLAQAAVNRVLGEDSELLELWRAAQDPTFLDQVTIIQAALIGPA